MDLTEKYTIRDLCLKEKAGTLKDIDGQTIYLGGFVKSNRSMGQVGFLSLNDGSCYTNIQVVYDASDK